MDSWPKDLSFWMHTSSGPLDQQVAAGQVTKSQPKGYLLWSHTGSRDYGLFLHGRGSVSRSVPHLVCALIAILTLRLASRGDCILQSFDEVRRGYLVREVNRGPKVV